MSASDGFGQGLGFGCGCVVAAILMPVMLWFGCFGVLTTMDSTDRAREAVEQYESGR